MDTNNGYQKRKLIEDWRWTILRIVLSNHIEETSNIDDGRGFFCFWTQRWRIYFRALLHRKYHGCWCDTCKNMARHTAVTIGSFPNTKQWLMAHTFDLMMIIINIHIFSQSSQEKYVNTHILMYCKDDKWKSWLKQTRLNILYEPFICSMSSVMYKETNTILRL